MRELVFKNLTSEDKRIKNISATEIMRYKNLLIETERNTKYFIHPTEDIDLRMRDNLFRKPHVYIKKDIKENRKKLSFKIVGRQFKYFKENIYPVDYEHSFVIEIVNLHKNNKKKQTKNEKKN